MGVAGEFPHVFPHESRTSFRIRHTDHQAWNLIWAPDRGHTGNYAANVLKAVNTKYKDDLLLLGGSQPKTDPILVDEMKKVVMREGIRFFRGENIGP